MTRILNIRKSPIIKNIPDKLIYKLREHRHINPPISEYVMFSTQKGNNSFGRILLGVMKNYGQWRDDYKDGPILLVHFIESIPRGQGFGEALIDFAKNYSKQKGCNGYIMLKATSIYENTPHLFYRKQNFSTLEPEIDKKMDKFINAKKEATGLDFRDMLMYYPPMKEKKPNLFQRFLNLFK